MKEGLLMNRIEERTNILIDEYFKAFLSFAIKRCRSYDDAMDLAYEILANCISSINKDLEIENFNAYLWSIAHNTYKRYLINL